MPDLRPDHLTVPLPARCAPHGRDFAEIMRRHAAAVAAGHPAYTDPATARSVFTAQWLADRGYCCTSGCRHCPYVQ